VDSSLRTRTATFYFSVVLGSKAGCDVRKCVVRQVARNNTLQATCEDARA